VVQQLITDEVGANKSGKSQVSFLLSAANGQGGCRATRPRWLRWGGWYITSPLLLLSLAATA
jgi:hypothetical protein